ncbi:Gfo/Idh/MocA family oxidoreductase [Orbaceae bacterium ESL0721]|nr:Gfo/Idh/MocA family oxidoreductase [Orbaceae bacterium ESL0721]
MNKLRAAIVGCGNVGHLHASAFINLEQSDFVAVCDQDIDQARKFAKQYGVKAYDNVEQMVVETKPQLISISTSHAHQDAILAAKMGCHILVEKPLATNLADCDAILAAAKFGGAKVGTVCKRRFYRPCLRIKQAIESGKIGRPIIGTVTMVGRAHHQQVNSSNKDKSEKGTIFVNQVPHQLDLLLWYMGEVEEVYSVWNNHPYREDDTVAAIIKFKNGGIGNIFVSSSTNSTHYGKVHIHGDNGASIGVQTVGTVKQIEGEAAITPPYNDIWTVEGEAEKLAVWKKEDSNFFNSIDSAYYYHQLQIENFINSLLNQTKPLVDGDMGRQTVEIIEAVSRSRAQKSAISFPIK